MRSVNTIPPAGDDQHGIAAGRAEDQRLRDLGHFAADRLGGLLRGTGGSRKLAQLRVDAEAGQAVPDTFSGAFASDSGIFGHAAMTLKRMKRAALGGPISDIWWAALGSNQRPLPCEGIFNAIPCNTLHRLTN